MMASVLQDPAYYMAAYKRLSVRTTDKAREVLLLQLQNAAWGMLRQKSGVRKKKPVFGSFFFCQERGENGQKGTDVRG